LLTALHVSDGSLAVTWIGPEELAAGALTLVGAREMLPVPACWVTVKVCGVPSSGVIAIVPVRLEISGFAAADHCNEPLPDPEGGGVMVSHGWLLDAVHWSAVSLVVSDIDPAPPEAGTLAAVGVTVSVPPACVIGKATAVPDEGVTVTVAVREAALGDAATAY
jgi:hypothetical protein